MFSIDHAKSDCRQTCKQLLTEYYNQTDEKDVVMYTIKINNIGDIVLPRHYLTSSCLVILTQLECDRDSSRFCLHIPHCDGCQNPLKILQFVEKTIRFVIEKCHTPYILPMYILESVFDENFEQAYDMKYSKFTNFVSKDLHAFTQPELVFLAHIGLGLNCPLILHLALLMNAIRIKYYDKLEESR